MRVTQPAKCDALNQANDESEWTEKCATGAIGPCRQASVIFVLLLRRGLCRTDKLRNPLVPTLQAVAIHRFEFCWWKGVGRGPLH